MGTNVEPRREPLKQTEIVPLPDNWSVATIGELFKFSSGKSRPEDIAEVSSDGKPYPVFGGNGVMGFASQYLIEHPTLVIGRVGVYCGCAHHTDGPAWISDNALYAKWVDERIDTRYARDFFEFANLNKYSSRAAQPLVTQGILSGIKVPLSPKEEQRRIAAALSAVQRAVERQERLIALTAELKKALMHKLFAEGARGEPLKQTEIGPVPQSWTLGRLREFLAIEHGYAFDGAYFRPDGERILMTPGHFDEDGGFRDQGARTKYYVGEVPSGYTLLANDLLVAMTEQKAGLLGSAALVPTVGTYLHNQRLGLVTSLNEAKLIKDFLYYFFNRPEVKTLVASTATGSKVRHTSPGKLLDLVIALPGVPEQKLISKALQKADAKRKVHLRLREALSDLFRTLLHQLMTAQIRVHDLDLSALAADSAKAAL